MKRILFVCHGNICRSPMAEFVFKAEAARCGRADDFFVESAAVSSEEIICGVGNPVYPPVAALLNRIGINCSDKRARLLLKEDGARFDCIVCMDDGNLRAAKRIVGADNASKCTKLLRFVGTDRDVSDPWYTRDFDACYKDVCDGVGAMLETL